MANSQAFCNQAKVDLMNGKHAFGTTLVRGSTAADSYKCALFEQTAGDKGAATTVYNTTGEVNGTNYLPGGVAVTTNQAPQLTSGVAHFTPSANITFTNVTLATLFDAALLYNDSHATKYALSVHTFAAQTVTAGDFVLTMPVDDNLTGLIRIN